IDGFMFDIEILMLAHQQGYAICDFPVEWTCDRDSRLSPSRQGGSVWRDLRAIRARIS
ncbi:MAG: glycosyltransferase family 2 protein, partial [Planctomycetes bacterium]|nr:glycosyltransferase family 2 protein [Planctomycetota bacterium]